MANILDRRTILVGLPQSASFPKVIAIYEQICPPIGQLLSACPRALAFNSHFLFSDSAF